MPDKTPNINLKSIKVHPTIHKEMKLESDERDENIQYTAERAWLAYKNAPDITPGIGLVPTKEGIVPVREVPDTDVLKSIQALQESVTVLSGMVAHIAQMLELIAERGRSGKSKGRFDSDAELERARKTEAGLKRGPQNRKTPEGGVGKRAKAR